MTGMAGTRRALGAAGACLLLGAAGAAPAQATGIYAALGDSYTAGPLILNPKGDPLDCGRSDHNYPTLVAGVTRPAVFRDVSCGSAQTKHMTEPQTGLPLGGTNPPQFGALTADVDLVTVGIGGNDMGFGGIVTACAEQGIRSGGLGAPCTERYAAGGRNQIAERIEAVVAPRLAAVIAGIQTRAPRARLVVVGDPDPVPRPPGCFPVVPIAAGDLAFLHDVARRLHEMKVRVAAEGGAEFVDLLTGSAGHDVCQLPGTKWYEGIVPTAPAYPAHPNVLGMEYAAREVLRTLSRPVPNDFALGARRSGRRGDVVLRLGAPSRGSFEVTARRRSGRRVVRYAAAQAFAPRAGELELRLRPGRSGRRAVRRAGRLRVSLQVTFSPVAGEPHTRGAVVRVGPRRRGRR